MGSSPSQQDYAPSEAEKASASVAMAEHNYFKEKYDPLLREMRDISKTADVATTLRGRSNADTMQALTGEGVPSALKFKGTQDVTRAADMSQALQGQLQMADEQAKDITNKQKVGVLGTARGQAADAMSGLAQASRLGTSQALARAQAKQTESAARAGMFAQLGTAAILKGGDNVKSGKKWWGGEKPPTTNTTTNTKVS